MQSKKTRLTIDLENPGHDPEEVFRSFLDWRARGVPENLDLQFSMSSVVFWANVKCFELSCKLCEELVQSWILFGWVEKGDIFAFTEKGKLLRGDE